MYKLNYKWFNESIFLVSKQNSLIQIIFWSNRQNKMLKINSSVWGSSVNENKSTKLVSKA